MNWLANVFSFTEAAWLFVIAVLVLALALSPLLPYYQVRRGDRSSREDAQLGFKVLLHYSFSVCVVAALIGLSIAVRGILEDRMRVKGVGAPYQDLGWSVALSAAVLAAMYYLLLYFGTNHRLFPAVGRVFTLWRFGVHNVVVVGAALLLAITLSESGPRELPKYHEYMVRQRIFLGVLIVWVPSFLVHLWLVWRQANEAVQGKLVKAVTWDVQEGGSS